MRPRGLPADDDLDDLSEKLDEHASMRPRGLPADDDKEHQLLAHGRQASMRPRGLPADDVPSPTQELADDVLQ